ncbi:lipid-A-disaccharide synthase [Sulfurivirga sp.]|uniref:lipid-A-disaccharide synthase n=1 Tax=Sulfurivirga sp. TaxID=2614236 RepID=UPI0025DF540A|nr:lipid-A-disaccharide synthase [Sulfurivirga sp.]
MQRPLTVAMVAGEASGDQLAADLMVALRQHYPSIRFVGIGGPRMQAEGLESWYDMNELSVMGFAEVVGRLPRLLKLRRALIARLRLLQPDLFIGVDAPDFNFTVERELKASGVPTVHYVGPSVWAWREKRLEKIRQCVDGVLLLFPFEPPLYERYGIPAAYVGHPLARKIPMKPDRHGARARLGLDESAQVTALLPGSRHGEVQRIFPVYLEAIALLRQVYPEMQFVVPAASDALADEMAAMIDARGGRLPVEILRQDGMALALQVADQAVVFSGTASLEAALYKCPMIITAKVSPLTYWIAKRLVKIPWVGLPNVLAGREIVPELIQDEARAERIAVKLGQLVVDELRRRRQIEAFETMHERLRRDSGREAIRAMQAWGVLPHEPA